MLTSLIQARLAYTGLFTGIYVALEPLPREADYAAYVTMETALIGGLLAGLAGLLFATSIFALWFRDRFWDFVFWALPFALGFGVALSLFEKWLAIFILQPLVYSVLGVLAGGLLGYWLNLLFCEWRRCPPDCPCRDHEREVAA
jgi:hypothetical protein